VKAAIYSPYLDTLGGGERYVLSVARLLTEKGWKVDVAAKDKQILEKASERLNLDLAGVEAVKDVNRGEGYDLCFWLSDGSVPRFLARKNILHFQRPFSGVGGKTLISRMKFFRVNTVVVNSHFTKGFIDQEFPKKAKVLYPPVDVVKFKAKKKENLIFYLGRFSQLEQAKRQDVLVEAFKKFYDAAGKGWQLVLAGGSDVGRTNFVDQLKEESKTYPIKIIENASFNQIKDFYARAKIFWSASGYGVDEKKQPQKVEHFGITVVEAMAAGAVPIIVTAGGHKEIIENGKNGFLWEKESELRQLTIKLVEDESLRRKLSRQVRADAQKYSYENFKKQFLALV
jgi:glycosyltransferase involved in cell wall biosynthesis